MMSYANKSFFDFESKKLFFFTLLALSVWIFLTPYKGISHDGVLYTAKAFRLLYPEIFNEDIFFKFGFQEGYTIFPYIYAGLMDILGYKTAAFFIAIAGQLLFLFGVVFLAHRLLEKKLLPLFLILLVTFEQYRHIFDLFEFYQTSRPFSAGLVFIFLAAITSHQWLLAVVAIIIAVLLHPLIALSGLIVAVFLLPWRYLIAAMLTGSLCLFFLVIFDIRPFGNLLLTFDEEWLEIVRLRSPFLFINDFHRMTWRLLYFLLTINLIAIISSQGYLRRILLANVIATFVTLVFSWLLIDQFHNVLLTQLQPWRIIFLFYAISLVALAFLLSKLFKCSLGRLLIVFLLAIYLHMGFLPIWISLLLVPVWYVYRDKTPPAKILWAIAWLVLALVLFQFFSDVKSSYRIGSNLWRGDSLNTILYLFDRWHVLILVVLLVLYVLVEKVHNNAVILGFLTIIALGILLASVQRANDRYVSPNDLTVDSIRQLQQIIPDDAEILWSNNLENAWYDLNRRFYVSRPQAASVVFNRDYAMKVKERSLPVFNAGFVEGQLDAFGRWGKTVKNKPDYSSIVGLCAKTTIDFILVENPVIENASETVQSGSRNIAVFQCSKLSM